MDTCRLFPTPGAFMADIGRWLYEVSIGGRCCGWAKEEESRCVHPVEVLCAAGVPTPKNAAR